MKKIILLSILIISNNILYSQSSWFWLQPIPTGATLNSVDFINKNTGYTCGKAGAITKTTNGGLNWTLLNSGTEYDLTNIKCLDANTCIVIGVVGLILKTTNGGLNWNVIPSGQTNILNEISFPSANTGYICAFGGIVLKSTNRGDSWAQIQTGLSATLYSISFLNDNKGAAGGFNTVFTTTNGGINWTTHILGSFFDVFQSVNYVNDSNLYVLWSTDDIVCKSTNGGINWNYYDVNFQNVNDIPRSMSFKDEYTGYISTSFGDIMKTTNGGVNWNLDTTFKPNFSYGDLLISVKAIDTNYVYTVGSGGLVAITTNSGAIWEIQVGNIRVYNDVLFTNDNIGYIIGRKGIYLKTQDAGLTWNQTNLNSTLDLNKIYFPNENTGYICGDTGLILKTTNAGLNWSSQISPSLDTNLLSIYFVNESTGFIGNFSGTVIKTTNGGTNWIHNFTIPDLTTTLIHDFSFFNENIGIGIASSRLLLTSNRGENWNVIPQPGSSLITGDYIDSLNIIAMGFGARIVKSTDGGGTWFSISNEFGANVKSSKFYPNNFGIICGDFGKIAKTTNGGINWIMQPRVASDVLNSVFFVNANTGFAAGVYGQIIKTTNGGLSFINSNVNLIPDNFKLFQNYPNPFNPKTVIRYSLKASTNIKINVYNALGKVIVTLLNKKQNAGEYKIDFDGNNLPSGIYFYSLFSNSVLIDTKKCLLIK